MACLPQQQTNVNLHHNCTFASQIFCRFKKAYILHFWSLEICGVDSKPLMRLAPSRVHFSPPSLQLLLHNSPSHPASNSVTAKGVDRDSKSQQQRAPSFCTTSTAQQKRNNLPNHTDGLVPGLGVGFVCLFRWTSRRECADGSSRRSSNDYLC